MDKIPPQLVKLLRYASVVHSKTITTINIAEVDVALNTLVVGQVLQFSASAQFVPLSLYIFLHCMLGCSSGVVGVLYLFPFKMRGICKACFQLLKFSMTAHAIILLKVLHRHYLFFLKLSKNNVGIVNCNIN